MKIIERFLQSKTRNQSDCEDSIFVSEDFAAVIDGVTTKSTIKYNHESPGKACSQILNKALENLPFNATANQAVELLISSVFAMYKDIGIEKHLINSPAEKGISKYCDLQ